MSDPLATDHLGLPYIAPAQAQKHVTHNEALRRLDTVVQLAVLDSSLADPPSSPTEGDRYIVAATATGVWTGKEGTIAAFVDGAWDFLPPEPGWLAYDVAESLILVRQSSTWALLGGFLGALAKLGINTAADDTHRLAVRSAAVLFEGIEAADGGTGDIRFILNKEADGDTASLLFQSGFSGRAEVGLAGDTDLVFKVSPDGSAWTEAIRIDKDTGLPTILYDPSSSGLSATDVQAAIDEIAAGSGGVVASVFGRTGAIAAALHDYDASQVDNDSGVSGATVKDAFDTLAASVGGKQDADSDLTALAGLSATGLVSRTGAGTAAARTLTAPAAGLTVGNGDGISGDPTLALANDLAALEGLASTGIAVRTASDTWAQRAVAAATGLSVANGSGASGNPTVALDVSALTEDTSPDPTADFWLTYNSSASGHKKVKPSSLVRERLTADRTYYVRTDGSNSNNGLANSSGGAFLTIQKAVSVVYGTLDLYGFNVTIQVGAGTYTGAVSVAQQQVGAGNITILGDTTTPANVILSVTSNSCITVDGIGTRIRIAGLKLATTTSGNGITTQNGGLLTISGKCEFGACATYHMRAQSGGLISAQSATYTISGSAQRHISAEQQAQVVIFAATVTLAGTPAFSGVFANAERLGFLNAGSASFSGSATGVRYAVASNAVISTGAGGASFFPGDSAGSTATGGQYI